MRSRKDPKITLLLKSDFCMCNLNHDPHNQYTYHSNTCKAESSTAEPATNTGTRCLEATCIDRGLRKANKPSLSSTQGAGGQRGREPNSLHGER